MKQYYLELELRNPSEEFKNYIELEEDIYEAVKVYNLKFKDQRELIVMGICNTIKLIFRLENINKPSTRYISIFSSYLYNEKNWEQFSKARNSLFKVNEFSEIGENFKVENETRDIKNEISEEKIKKIVDSYEETSESSKYIEDKEPITYDKTDKVCIKINPSRLENYFQKLRKETLKEKDWKTPLGVAISILLVLLTAEFKNNIIDGKVIEGIFIAVFVMTLIMSIRNYLVYKECKSEYIIRNIMDELQED